MSCEHRINVNDPGKSRKREDWPVQ
jgi:hypothetical protein